MHLLAHDQEVLADRIIVALPERVGIVADIAKKAELVTAPYRTTFRRGEWGVHILDCHQTNAGKNAHYAEELPEIETLEQAPTTNIYTMGTIHINTVLH
jgi:hypothetical protein